MIQCRINRDVDKPRHLSYILCSNIYSKFLSGVLSWNMASYVHTKSIATAALDSDTRCLPTGTYSLQDDSSPCLPLRETALWSFTETADLYRETADLYRETADLYRETADLYRETADLYRETADLYRQTADLYRETADLYRDS